MATKETFFNNTFAIFEQVLVKPETITELGIYDFISESGSIYWYIGEYLYRYSNHWGGVSTCIWRIKGRYNAKNGYKLGRVKFVKIEPIVSVIFRDLISETLRDRIYELKRNIPTHKSELHQELINVNVRLSFVLGNDKYQKIYGTPCWGINSWNSIVIKQKNIDCIKLYAAKIERIVEPIISDLELKFKK